MYSRGILGLNEVIDKDMLKGKKVRVPCKIWEKIVGTGVAFFASAFMIFNEFDGWKFNFTGNSYLEQA